jgi:prepilin-type N-terminal cleavage/methylation domain-containing protein
MRRGQQAGFTLLELAVTLTVAAIILAVTVPGIRSTIAVYQRNGAAREVLAQIRNAQSAAITRDGVYVFQWGGDTTVNYSLGQYRLVKDTGVCSLPSATASSDNNTVLVDWTDVAATYPGTKIQSVVDNSGTAVGKVMFNSRGASVNTCTSASFPITVTVADSLGNTRQIQIRSAGSVKLL